MDLGSILSSGGPGSGKGSQTARLVRCFGLRAISLGDLLRKQLSHSSPSRKWEVISEMMSHGELGPQVSPQTPEDYLNQNLNLIVNELVFAGGDNC